MLKIYKYPLGSFVHKFEINLPRNAQVLKVDLQGAHPVMWVLLDPSAELSPREFFFVETGASIDDDLLCKSDYIGTIQTNNNYVLHLFERP